jgi:hypothetical protein
MGLLGAASWWWGRIGRRYEEFTLFCEKSRCILKYGQNVFLFYLTCTSFGS